MNQPHFLSAHKQPAGRSNPISTASAMLILLLVLPTHLPADTEAQKPTYTWSSSNKTTTVDFVCTQNNVTVHIHDPARAAVGLTYPVDVRTAVTFSPVLGSQRDWRLLYHEQFSDNTITMRDGRQFLRDLHALHRQEISNRKMVKDEYERAIAQCDSRPTEEDRNRCFEVLTPGAYLMALGPHPAITIDVDHHTDAGPEEGFHAARTVAAFNSEALLQDLEALGCLED